VLLTTFALGYYYPVPRRISSEELSKHLKADKSIVVEYLRKAEKNQHLFRGYKPGRSRNIESVSSPLAKGRIFNCSQVIIDRMTFPISMEKEIVTQIEIDAPPSRVWEVLTDFEKHSVWNPFIKKISGKPTKDEKLEVHMPDPQGGTMVFTPTILAAERDRELRWLGRSEGDVFNGEHRFLIEPIKNNKVHFRQSEKFTGSMVAQLEEWLDTAVKQNFEDMNRALKQRAENQ
jgi:hypothetical protein